MIFSGETRAETFLYEYGRGLYINLTNRCPCDCTFCIRGQVQGVGNAGSLWLEEEPTAEQVILGLGEVVPAEYDEVVFCGFGEPMCALDVLTQVCRHLKSRSGCPPIRLNTNGLGDLINQRPTAPLLEGLIDIVSISMNAPDKDKYMKIVRPTFGEIAFDAMLDFAISCKQVLPKVQFSVVSVLPPDDMAACREISDRLGIPLRVREFGS